MRSLICFSRREVLAVSSFVVMLFASPLATAAMHHKVLYRFADADGAYPSSAAGTIAPTERRRVRHSCLIRTATSMALHRLAGRHARRTWKVAVWCSNWHLRKEASGRKLCYTPFRVDWMAHPTRP